MCTVQLIPKGGTVGGARCAAASRPAPCLVLSERDSEPTGTPGHCHSESRPDGRHSVSVAFRREVISRNSAPYATDLAGFGGSRGSCRLKPVGPRLKLEGALVALTQRTRTS